MIRCFLAIILLTVPAGAHADAAKDAALTRYLTAINAEADYNEVAGQAMSQFVPLVQMNAAKQKEAAAIIQGEMVPLLKAAQPTFNRAIRAAYDKRFSTAELNQMADFIASPVGIKMRTAQHDIGPEVMQSMGGLQQDMRSKAVPHILAKMKAAGMRVPPLPQQRKHG